MKRKPPLLDKPYRKHRAVSDDEKALWLEAIDSKKHTVAAKSPKSPPVMSAATQKVPCRNEVSLKKKIKALPLPEKVDFRTRARILQKKLAIGATLDLHGFTRITAHEALERFLLEAQGGGVRLALVITGKGKAGGLGALHQELPRWLAEPPLRDCVIAFDTADPRHGGHGAWYVRIRKGSGSGGQGPAGNVSGSGF